MQCATYRLFGHALLCNVLFSQFSWPGSLGNSDRYVQSVDMDYNKRAETVSEEEEEDEMMMLVFPALYLASIRTRTRTPCYTSKLSGSEYTRELLEGHPHRSYHNLRMEPWIFKALADYLSSRGLLKSTRGVTVEEQLALFMYMLARNASFTALCNMFQHSGETIHRHIAAAFDAISSLAFDFVKPPSSETHWKISTNPHFAPYFQVHITNICTVSKFLPFFLHIY